MGRNDSVVDMSRQKFSPQQSTPLGWKAKRICTPLRMSNFVNDSPVQRTRRKVKFLAMRRT